MKEKTFVWDLPVRVFHWALAGSFAGAWLLSESERMRNVHVMLGYTALALIAFRVLWGFVGTRYARFSSFAYGPKSALRYLASLAMRRPAAYQGHNPAGSWAVYALLLLGVATGVTGYLNLNSGGETWEELHESLATAWLAVVALHIAGVVVSSIAHRENLARAMVTGYKQGASCTSEPVRARAIGAAMAAAVLGCWTWSLLSGQPVGATGAQPDRGESRLALGGNREDD